MTKKEKVSLYESIMRQIASDLKRQINEMSPDVYRNAAFARRHQGNTEAAKRLEAHADNMDKLLSDAINNDDRTYIIKQYPGAFFVKDGQICCNVTVIDKEGDKKGLTLTAGTMKDLLKRLYVLFQASVKNMAQAFFEFKINKSLNMLLKKLNNDMSDAEADELDELADSLYDAIFKDAVAADDISENIIRFDFGF
jgi:uncharacterized protein YozE (UPF0346 family)